MAYQVLARKWRPQTFAEMVGQEHLARTLKNAIRQNRIGHAYLFVGSRGIGKTTTARIFAKALNCRHNQDGEPCCQCDNCLEIAQGNSMDVIEIDGASHNKVEDIRDIRDGVQYTPVKGKYKIYIIDEVHMLTTAAWNALLKTLEEPPEHVKFLFATTEPHKVLPTIVSRCQRFDLRRIPVPLIVQRLRQICDGEHIAVEDAALTAIARAADGGMRDAQSILDQMIAFCGGADGSVAVSEQDVVNVFGLASGQELSETAAALFANDLDRAFAVIQVLADGGRDLERFFDDLVGFMRNLMLAATCRDAARYLEVSETEMADLLAIGKGVPPRQIQQALQLLLAQEWSFRTALNKRLYLEVVLSRVTTELHSVQLDDIMTHLNVLGGFLPPQELPAPNHTVNLPPSTRIDKPAPTAKPVVPPATAPAPAVAQKPQPPAPEPRPQPEPAPMPAPVPPMPAVAPQAASKPAPMPAEPVAMPECQPIPEYASDEQPEYSEQNIPSSVLMSDSNPADLYQRLLNELGYAREQKLLDMIDHGFQPISFENNLLTLGYSFNDVDADDVRQLLDARNNVVLQMVFRKVWPNGKILLRRITEDGLEETAHKGLRHATEDERKEIAERPAIRQLRQALNVEVIDARIKE